MGLLSSHWEELSMPWRCFSLVLMIGLELIANSLLFLLTFSKMLLVLVNGAMMQFLKD